MIQHSSETLQYCIQNCVSRYELGPREDRNPSICMCVQADSINPFRFLWIVDCEAVRGDWMMKISGVTENLTPGVSQNRPEDLDKHTKFCGRYNTSKNDMQ